MKRLGALRIGQIIGLGFGLILLAALLIALVGRVAYDITQQQRETIQARSEVESLTLTLEVLSIKRTEALRRYLESGNVGFLANFQTFQAAYADTHSRLARLLYMPQETQSFQAVVEAETSFNDKIQAVLRLSNEGHPDEARFLWIEEGITAQDDLFKAIEALRQIQDRMSTTIINEARQTESVAILIVSVFVGMVLIGGLVASYIITRTIVRPLSSLVDTTSAIGMDLATRVEPSGPREIAFLGETISQMAVNLSASRQALQAHKERMERELRLASQIQTSFFPEVLPRSLNLEIAAFWQPAQETAGDFYTCVMLENGQQGLVVGDVSGKGVPAAMAGALAVGLLEAYAPRYVTPEALLDKLNQELCSRFSSNSQLNVACCYAILNPVTFRLSVANAGCLHPYLKRDSQLQTIEVDGPPLGIWCDVDYTAQTCALQPGDLLLLSSDGLVEAMNGKRELFGFDRLEAELLKIPANVTAYVAINQLVSAALTFTGPVDLHDDITLLMVRVVGEKSHP